MLSPQFCKNTALVGCSADFLLFQQFKLKKYTEGVMMTSKIYRGTTWPRRDPGVIWMIWRELKGVSPSALLSVKSESAAVFNNIF